MTTIKKKIEQLARWCGLERLIFRYVFLKDQKKNKQANHTFRQAHKDYPLPPDFLRFDVIATTNAQYFYQTGKETASVIAPDLLRYLDAEAPLQICEWGCGPGRILHFLKNEMRHCDVKLHGTDMYAPSIRWARAAMGHEIDFRFNQMLPPLEFGDNSMHAVYAVSVFTHLSEKLSQIWMQEIMRVLRPGGIFWFTSHSGLNHRHKLSDSKQRKLDEGRYVSLSSWHNGSQMYEGIHPEPSMRSLIAGANGKVLQYLPAGLQKYQDIWIVQKNP